MQRCAHVCSVRHGWLRFRVLSRAAQGTEAQRLYFKPRTPRTRRKGAGDAAGTAKGSQAVTMETEVEITEQGSEECETRASPQKALHGRPCHPGTEAARVGPRNKLALLTCSQTNSPARRGLPVNRGRERTDAQNPHECEAQVG